MQEHKDRYRRVNPRLKDYDYSQTGHYFVTICTKDKIPFFGETSGEGVALSVVGKLSRDYWQEIPEHFPFVSLDEFVIMPNHIHGIIVICRDNKHVGTCHGMSPPKTNQFSQPKSGSLSIIINHFKGAVTRKSKQIGLDFYWQSRFYEHIIRDEESLKKIREYIKLNPLRWEIDKYHIVGDK